MNSLKRHDWNCAPLSVVTTLGVPKIEIQSHKIAFATVTAVVSLTGMAVGHREKRSTIVKR